MLSPLRRARALLPLAVLAIAGGIVLPERIAADEVLLVPPPLIRKFPQDVFCPIPVTMQFTANAGTAVVHAIANTYVHDGSSFLYTHQAIDNMYVVPLATYNANLVANDGDYDFCYLNDQVPQIFLFDQVTPGSGQLEERFTLGAAGWDLAQGAYWDGTRSAHNDPSNISTPHNQTGGCLGLGQENATPALTDSARTSATIVGLTAGQDYVLSGWWTVGDGIFTEDASLTIKIVGPGAVPVQQRTWGAVKSRYRR